MVRGECAKRKVENKRTTRREKRGGRDEVQKGQPGVDREEGRERKERATWDKG